MLNFIFINQHFCLTAEFATLEWSPDETKIVYIAEKKVPKSEPFYKQKPKPSNEQNETDSNTCVPVLSFL